MGKKVIKLTPREEFDKKWNEKIDRQEIKLKREKDQLTQMLMNQISDIQYKIADTINGCIKSTSLIKLFLNHRHENHKHASYRGHSYGECSNDMIKLGWIFRYHKYYETIGSGTYFPYKQHFIDLLFLEMNNMKDYDGNGMVFFKDFVIDLNEIVEEEEIISTGGTGGTGNVNLNINVIPMQLKAYGISHWYPDSSTYPYVDDNGNTVKVNTTHFSYMDAKTGNISYIKREKECQIISWREYIKTVPECFGGSLKEEENE